MEYKIYNIKNEKSFQNNLLLAQQSHHILKERNGKGNDFLGWLDLPDFVSEEYISKIQNIAKEFSKKDVVVIIGIGGSYLGAKAVIEALKPQFAKNKPEIIFAGHTLSEDYYSELLDYLKGKKFCRCNNFKIRNHYRTCNCIPLIAKRNEKHLSATIFA